MPTAAEDFMKHEITRADVLTMDAYERVRDERRAGVREQKRLRRVAVGPFAVFYFENYDTLWLQVHEMLRTEGGGEDQVTDELDAYNPLIPNGSELVATLMFEIPDKSVREAELGRLGGVEETIRLRVGGSLLAAVPERDQERSTAEGRTSSVHFLHFPMTPGQAAAFRSGNGDVALEIGHERYRHAAGIARDVREALATDLDA